MATIHFKGKSYVQNHHLTLKYHHLVPNPAASLTDKISLHDNLIIHGDNLLALKALLPTYAGKVKCIYIDPPYNTGNEGWIYNDNVNSPMMQEWLKANSPVDKEDLARHDKWLCMMMPRLKLLRELLRDDGVIFVSIDDNEVHHLRMLMDEIFGEEYFIGNLVWKRRQNVDSRAKNSLSVDHEYVLTYCKSTEALLRGKEKDLGRYSNPDNDPRGEWASDNLVGLATKEQRPNLHYDLINPGNGNVYTCPKESGWRYSPETMKGLIEDNRILWPTEKSGRPRLKRYKNELLNEFTGFSTYIAKFHSLQGTRELKDIFSGKDVLDFPKPSEYIKLIVEQATGLDAEAIILDSFAGSRTTAHAVLALNQQNGGNRKFILIEMEDYAESLTAERVKRVIQGVPKTKDEALKNGLGGSFSFFELGEPVEMQAILEGDSLPAYDDLARYVFYTATGDEFDPAKVDLERNFIGENKEFEVYLLYQPDLNYLRSTSLDLDKAEKLGLPKPNCKKRLVFAPMKYLDTDTLERYRIEYCQLPFEIYKFKE